MNRLNRGVAFPNPRVKPKRAGVAYNVTQSPRLEIMVLSGTEAFNLQEKLEALGVVTALVERLSGWIKALLIGAIGVALWAAALQWRVQLLTEQVQAIQQDRAQTLRDYRDWQRQVSTDVATTKNNVEWIRSEMQKR